VLHPAPRASPASCLTATRSEPLVAFAHTAVPSAGGRVTDPRCPASPRSVLLMLSAYGTRPLGQRRDGLLSRYALSCVGGAHSAREVAASSFRSDGLGGFAERLGDALLSAGFDAGFVAACTGPTSGPATPGFRLSHYQPAGLARISVDPTDNRSRSSFRSPLRRYSTDRRSRPRVRDACARRTWPRQWQTRSAQVCGGPFPWPSESPDQSPAHSDCDNRTGHPRCGIAADQRTCQLERDCQAATR
jgi:hypothetical protein